MASSIDPLLQGLTQAGAQILDPAIVINPLNNYFFTTASSILIIGLGWYITDKLIEPRLQTTEIDGDADDHPEMHDLDERERKGLRWALVSMVLCIALLIATAYPSGSPWRDASGEISSFGAPIMRSIVSLIFLLFLIPGIVYAFGQSNLGVLLALQGAALLKALAMPAAVTIVGIIFLTAFVNIFVGSASGKWGLLAPIFVPMLMSLGISPDFTQAAYRVGDSSTNIITPLMPYFPLVVVYCQRYVKSTGIGTLTAMMLPYSLAFLGAWTVFLLVYFWDRPALGNSSELHLPIATRTPASQSPLHVPA